MNVFVTGATGFVTGNVARRLIERGHRVRALVRDPARAARLGDAELVHGGLGNDEALRVGMRDVDAVIHGAAVYQVGLTKREREEMHETNVRGTAHVLSAAKAARVPRVVYISTIGVFGNTHGHVVDETFKRTDQTFTSYYEETKLRAHEIAEGFVADGLPVVIVQPGQVYGPGDHSGFGGLMSSFARGRLPVLPFPDLGLNMTYVDDIADGILLALERGTPGRSYVMGGEIARVVQIFGALGKVVGRSAPRWSLPYGVLELASLVRPQLKEVISSSRGVTFWATDSRARSELGYAPRSLEEGLRQTYGGYRSSSSSSSSSSSDSNSSE
jgi:nucleoside-diphosphate-sugar epimerase